METPAEHTDPINASILSISEDQISGFEREPFLLIAERSGVPFDLVVDRIQTMLKAGTIRRVRQTLLATNLAPGALVAWRIPANRLDAAFDFMVKQDPFSGHVVVRSTDAQTAGSDFRLWTTLKVPLPYSREAHCELLARITGAETFRIMPAKGIFALGVGHVRRKKIEPGDKTSEPAQMLKVELAELSDLEWRVLLALKEELTPDEIGLSPWKNRAERAGVTLDTFYTVAEALSARRIIGRFSTFLEHVKPTVTGQRVTRFNALFHWAVPPGEEARAGAEVGRHEILTHCYWRESGPEFNHVSIMAVAHGSDKERVFAHKAAIDDHLKSCNIPISYTNVFWGGRSEIKPSEISPQVYKDWIVKMENAPSLS